RGPAPRCRSPVSGEPAGKRWYPLVSELAADGIPVAVTCRVLDLARQPYYRWLKNPVTAAELDEAYRANALFDAHREDPEFGYRYLADEAGQNGESMCRRTAWRICSTNGWTSSIAARGRGRHRKPRPPGPHDLVERDFTADAPNRLWLTDITEHRTGEGKLYLCAIKDVYSGRIVGYSMDARMKSRLAVNALNSAAARRGTSPGASSTAIEDRSSGRRRCSGRSAPTAWSDRWAGSARPATTPPWRASFRCSRTT